jgi:hypothetical protein
VVGVNVRTTEGDAEGPTEGLKVGIKEGVAEGLKVGSTEGEAVGARVGTEKRSKKDGRLDPQSGERWHPQKGWRREKVGSTKADVLRSDTRDESWIQGRHDRGVAGGVHGGRGAGSPGEVHRRIHTLRGYEYEWKQEWDPHLGRRSGRRLGLLKERKFVPQITGTSRGGIHRRRGGRREGGEGLNVGSNEGLRVGRGPGQDGKEGRRWINRGTKGEIQDGLAEREKEGITDGFTVGVSREAEGAKDGSEERRRERRWERRRRGGGGRRESPTGAEQMQSAMVKWNSW